MNLACGHCVLGRSAMPGELEGAFVAVDVVIIEVGVFVVMHRQIDRRPTPGLIDHDLAAFDFGLVPVEDFRRFPHWPGCFHSAEVRPKNGACRVELSGGEQEFWIDQGHVVGVQEQYFPELRMQ